MVGQGVALFSDLSDPLCHPGGSFPGRGPATTAMVPNAVFLLIRESPWSGLQRCRREFRPGPVPYGDWQPSTMAPTAVPCDSP
jgi:hypothetical protein